MQLVNLTTCLPAKAGQTIFLMLAKAKQKLNNYHRRWKVLQWMECFIYALAGALVVMSLGFFIFDWSVVNVLLGSLVLALIASFVMYKNRLVQRGDIEHIVRLLNDKHLALEQSIDLLFVPSESLNGLAALQQQKVAESWVNLKEPTVFKNRIPRAVSLLLCSLVFMGAMWAIPNISEKNKVASRSKNTLIDSETSAPNLAKATETKIEKITLTTSPPAYTKLATFSTEEMNLEVPWNSNIQWEVQFNTPVEKAVLVLNGKERINLSLSKKHYSGFAKLSKSGFYFIEYQGVGQELKTSDYYKITVVEDQVPLIAVEGIENFTSYAFDNLPDINFQTQLQDDYGITDAYIVATLSRGKGESVKFREDTMRYNNSFTQHEKQYNLPFQLSLNPTKKEKEGAIQVEPGDELYFQIETIDNRQPNPQLSKTQKFIIAIEDTSTVVGSPFGGLGVNRLPEYFRSQRQIIIDTEKLIAKRGQIETTAFQEQSNNIAIDQKLLRLRYGKFLGEEFESVIGHSPEEEDEEEHEHEEGEEHDHDHEHDHDNHEGHDHDSHAGHDHEDEAIDPFANETDTLLEGFAHFHDMTEHATLYDESTSAKLREALSEMWNSELHLRMGEPEKALPYEYKALKMIKAIQQASRIYVARVGFEPPTINVAKSRYTGELDKIQNVNANKQRKAENDFQNIDKAIPLIERLFEKNNLPDTQEKQTLKLAAQQLATIALNQPGPYLKALQQLRLLTDTEVPISLRGEYYQSIREAFAKLTSKEELIPVYQQQRQGRLSGAFLKAISS